MIQCKDCEFYQEQPDGKKIFKCNPFSNIKEPQCLLKWQLLRLDTLVSAYRAMMQMQHKLAPLQDKILKYMEREIQDMDDSEQWKQPDDEDQDDSSAGY